MDRGRRRDLAGVLGAGRPLRFGEALIIESLGHAARTAAFFIPGGLGVQDGALLLLGSAVGLGPDAGLVLALTKRLREVALGVPALATGYVTEARRFTRGARAGKIPCSNPADLSPAPCHPN